MIFIKQFNCLGTSSKIAICGLPLRADSYRTCSFMCSYCFSNNKVIRKTKDDELQVANVKQLKTKMDKVFNKNIYDESNLVDILLKDDITWHYGGMSDPFQHCEAKYEITKQIVDIANEYNRTILFSTKTDNIYNVNLRPELHSIQMSFSNTLEENYIEPGVPSLQNRIRFFNEMKDQGFKVGIRIQPFIPGITNTELVEIFKDADYFTIEGLKLVPQNKEMNEQLIKTFNLKRENFTQKGLLNLKPDLREKEYQDFISALREYNIPFSIADNDMRSTTSGKCCCGDPLIHKSTDFNVTAMINDKGSYDYTKNDVLAKMNEQYKKASVKGLFTSNRQKDVNTLEDLIEANFDKKTNPLSPKFQYKK